MTLPFDSPELNVLLLAALLQVLQFGMMSIAANLDVGPGKTMSARDESRMGGSLASQLSDKPARLFRAFNNHFEGLILFTIAVLIITVGDKASAFSATCAWVYLAARILYIPAYYFGLAPWRSLIWFAGFLATLLMLLSTFI